MAALLAQLPGPINLRLVLSDLHFADILNDLVTAKGNRSGVPRVLAVDRNETRELAGTLHLEGASKDDAIAQIRAINALVTVGTTLTLQSADATNAVTLKILPSRGVSQPLDELFELPKAPPGANLVAAAPAGSNWAADYLSSTYGAGDAVVALRFDDGRSQDWSVTIPRLEQRGLHGGFAIVYYLVDHSSDYLSLTELQRIQSGGHEIMCHSYTHDVDPASYSEFYHETVDAKAALEALGFTVASFVQPGSWSDTYNIHIPTWTMGSNLDLLLRANFDAYEGYYRGNFLVLPVASEYRYGSNHYSPDCYSAGGAVIAKEKIDYAIAHGNGVEFLFHSVTIGAAGISVADFDSTLDYLAAQQIAGNLTVLTPTQYLYAVQS